MTASDTAHQNSPQNIPKSSKICLKSSEDPDQTAQMRSLVRVFSARMCQLLLFFHAFRNFPISVYCGSFD